MSKFGCIDFSNDNIILSKEGLERTKNKKVFLEPMSYLEVQGYNIHILNNPNNLSERDWYKIEDELLQKNVFYVAMKQNNIPYPFRRIEEAKGEDIKVLLAPYLLEYIFKYNLINKDPKYAKIGIIGGRINKTLDVLIPIIEHVIDITLFTNEPEVYREIVQDIYQKTRIRMKLMYPNPRILQEMNIIYDVNENKSYINWCNLSAIYIDFFRNTNQKKCRLNEFTPSIWEDFDITCERQPINKAVLEAILYTDGFTRHILRKKIKNLNIGITRVYTLLKVDNH